MKASWKGSIEFCGFPIPVRIGSATGDSDAGFRPHQYSPDNSRIRFRRVSEATGEEVAYADIKKGWDAADGSVVFLTDEEVMAAYGPVSRLAALKFTDAAAIPDIAKAKQFIVQPDTGGERGYALLVRALQRSGKAGITQLGVQARKRLAVVSATADNYLSVTQLEWPADIRRPDFTAPAPNFSETEEKLATELVEKLSDDFDYWAQADNSQVLLSELIQEKLGAGESARIVSAGPAQAGTVALDLMSTLLASLDAVKAAKAPKKRAPRKPRAVPAESGEEAA